MTDKLRDLFREAIQSRRWDLGLTQNELERKAKLRHGFISYLETGRMKRLPLPETFIRLCRALNFTEIEILDLAGYVVFDAASLSYIETAAKGTMRLAA